MRTVYAFKGKKSLVKPVHFSIENKGGCIKIHYRPHLQG